MTSVVGIDLGTTNSAVAILDEDCGPVLIPNNVGDLLTPSVVGIDENGSILVGRAARELQIVHPERCASAFKRIMGTDEVTELDGSKFTPEELSALVLCALKEDAERHLGHPVKRAVITVPAYFNDHQRTATMNAGRIAGFQVDRIINEPTAAAIAYGLHEADSEKVVAVYDLGGGTFDISIVEFFEGVVEVRSSCGESFLGGEDFTRRLAARVLDDAGLQLENLELSEPEQISRLSSLCERAKVELSCEDKTTIDVPALAGKPEQPAIVTADQFRTWTQDILAGTLRPIRSALHGAELTAPDLSEVILVGGASYMPAVHRQVEETLERTPLHRLNPEYVVALGAAVQAGLIEEQKAVGDMVVTDVAPFTLGVEITKQFGRERKSGFFQPIISRNTGIPVSRVESFSTMDAFQSQVRLKIYQGESRHVKNNLLLGELVVSGIPQTAEPQEIAVRMTYDLNGILEVEATIVSTQRKAQLVITKHASGMGQKDIDRAVKRMAELKVHPRDVASHRELLLRAERLYTELTAHMREELSMMLDMFENALEHQEPKAIENAYRNLREFLDRLENGL